MSAWTDFVEGFDEDLHRGNDDIAQAFYKAQKLKELDNDAPKFNKMLAEHPVIYRARELFHDNPNVPDFLKADSQNIAARQEMGFGPKSNMAGRLGQLGGAIGNDALFDKTRSIYWLLNAAQAAGAVINEGVVAAVNPDLYGSQDLGMKYDLSQMEPAGLAHLEANGKLAPNQRIFKGENGNAFRKNYRSGAVQALGVPAGFAINQGLGLMTPFGGYEGYEAAIPDPEDKSKTANVVGEIAAKYIMGRTGNLLPYDEFSKVRPDVSKGEYNAYKAFKYDKKGDINPFDDGQVTLPTGVLKATTDGIHGAEVQFLGRSLPVNTAIIPFASAVAGTALGGRRGRQFRQTKTVDPNAVRRGAIGGTVGAVGGIALGNLLEAERRRRNEAANGAGHDSTGMM